MKEKLYDPARHNEQSPAEGMASVNTHNPEEESVANNIEDQKSGENKTQQETTESTEKNSRSSS